jgi:deoxycytidylate deaminase
MHLRLALREASKARHPQHRHGALLLRGGNVIARAHNFSHLHAEEAVIGRAWRSKIKGTTLVVIRVTRGGQLSMSKPCERCLSLIAAAGVRKVIYTNNVGELEESLVDQLKPKAPQRPHTPFPGSGYWFDPDTWA